MLGYTKNYAILALKYVLKNLEETISVSGIDRSNNIE